MESLPADPAFADCPDRHGTGSEKWDRYFGRDVVPLWVADMDFRTAEVIRAAIHERVEHGVFGYTNPPPGFAPSLADHLALRHGWQVDPGSITGTPGVVTGLALTARLLAEPGDEILSFTPVYPPFLTLPGLAGRCPRRGGQSADETLLALPAPQPDGHRVHGGRPAAARGVRRAARDRRCER
jgi:bifunctional pyridoxal-dependent enzyme with beta-cystathionase and maltose regulon repressor activities